MSELPVRLDSKSGRILVVGGGFFGVSLSLRLASMGYSVDLVERESGILRRASYGNQARVHIGAHYPRSMMTAVRSREHCHDFCEDFSDAIVDSFVNYYGVAKDFSKVSASQFEHFMCRAGIGLGDVSSFVLSRFNMDRVDKVWSVFEPVFDARALAVELTRRLDSSSVSVFLSTELRGLAVLSDEIMSASFSSGEKNSYSWVFNCTYSGLNRVNGMLGLPALGLKHELTEMALVKPPKSLLDGSFTLMCGPFFSLMPFPARGPGVYTLSHVRYTPHFSWDEGMGGTGCNLSLKRESNFSYMLADAVRFMPSLRDCEYLGSIWEVKTVLPRSELDDGRPILFRREPALPGLVHILGGKMDNIYDVFSRLDSLGFRGEDIV